MYFEECGYQFRGGFGGKKSTRMGTPTTHNVIHFSFYDLLSSLISFHTIAMPSTAESDTFFLSWGSSVNVNEDLRRTIRKEVDDIDDSINNLQVSVKGEDATSLQLARDLSHARKEMLNLSRRAADSVDNEKMKGRIRQGLMEVFQGDLVRKFGDRNEHSATEIAADEGTPNADAGRNDTQKENLYLDRNGDLAGLSLTARKAKSEVLDLKAQMKKLGHDKETLEQQAAVEKLDETIELASIELESKVKQLKHEEARIRTIKEAIHIARTSGGKHAQEIANLVSPFPQPRPTCLAHLCTEPSPGRYEGLPL